MLDRAAPEALLSFDRTLRLLPPEVSVRVAKWRFTLLVAICLIFHIVIVGLLLWRGMSDVELPPSEEIPVEIVEQMPGAPPPPPPEQQKPLPKPEEKMKMEESLKPAYDAPRAPNEEKVEREAPQKETHAPEPEQKPVKERPAENMTQPDTQKIADAPTPTRSEERSLLPNSDDKPDAEVLKLELQQNDDKKKSNSDPARTKKPLPTDQKAALSRQLAALAPTPDYTLGAKSKPAIVSGGTENTTYFSICNGLIMKQLKHTEYVRSSAGVATVFIAVDENGNLMHQALFKTSGFPDVDQDAMTAVRRAAPFPPPPRYLPTREFLFSLGVERGH